MTLKTLAAAACISLAAASSASAATFNILGGFSGGQLGDVSFDVTIDADFSANISSTSSGLTVNSLTSSVVAGDPFPLAGGLAFSYTASSDNLSFGGGLRGTSGLSELSNDFIVWINLSTSAISTGFDSYSQTADFDLILDGYATVTEVSAVPLPAGGILLLSGFAGVAGLKRRKKRAA